VLFVAGAGYGKTMALEEALAARPTPCVWLRCTWADRDAGRLLNRLVDGLRVAAPGAVDVLAERLAGALQIDVEAATADLLSELDHHLLDPVVVVIDDTEQLADSATAIALVGDLLAARSAALRVAVATRQPLPLNLAKLRGAGRLLELGPGDLAFNPEECRELLTIRREGPPAPEDVEELFAGTEGWPLGASLGAARGHAPGIGASSSRARVFDFLREEVLEPLPADLREYLIDSAVPEELNRSSMRALGLPEDFPDRVMAAGLPLRAVGADEEWFFHHPLVREFLLERLTAERTSEAQRELHARVAPSLAEAGRPEEAVEHWLAAASWPDAVAAITDTAPGMLHTAPATVRRWLGALPAHARSAPPCLLLDGTLEWEEGHLAEAVDRLRRAVDGYSAAGDVPGEWLARFALADPLWLSGDHADEVIALADGFDDQPALAAGVIAPVMAAYAAAALGAVGRVHECQELGRRVLAHPHLGPLHRVRVAMEFDRLALSGDFDELIRSGEEAVRELERFDPINRLPTIAQLHALSLGHQGRDAEALVLWERVEAFARSAHVPWVVKVSHFWRALLHARGGRIAPAEEHLALAGAAGAGGWSEWALEAAGAKIAALRGDWDEAVSASGRALSLAPADSLTHRFTAVIELAPILFEAGQPARARSLVDDELALCDERIPGVDGSYFRALLLGVRAWLCGAAGDEAGAGADLQRMWETAGPNTADVVRREWRLLEQLLWTALERGTLNPDAVLESVEAAWPGGEASLSFTSHPEPNVRAAALASAARSGSPELVSRLDQLQRDADPGVAAGAAAAAKRLRAEPPPLAFTMLGGFQVRRGSWRAEDSAWDRRVAQRLVRYLLVRRGSLVADDLLLEAFWPDTPQDRARKSLKVAVSCARAVLDVPGAPSVIDSVEHTLTLRLRPRDSVDVDRFEEAARIALAAEHEKRRPLLERAMGLWTGDPLPEERYADWTLAWREALTLRYAQVLSEFVRSCRAEHDELAAASAAQELVELDPLNEAAHRELMLSYARSGRRAHALRQYLECRRRLVGELGIDPARETTELQQLILAGETV
jgi:ATP/maltotriose-dependent transcriptional regulator MalT/DNA-binding SARP family transcriptional activator